MFSARSGKKTAPISLELQKPAMPLRKSRPAGPPFSSQPPWAGHASVTPGIRLPLVGIEARRLPPVSLDRGIPSAKPWAFLRKARTSPSRLRMSKTIRWPLRPGPACRAELYRTGFPRTPPHLREGLVPSFPLRPQGTAQPLERSIAGDGSDCSSAAGSQGDPKPISAAVQVFPLTEACW